MKIFLKKKKSFFYLNFLETIRINIEQAILEDINIYEDITSKLISFSKFVKAKIIVRENAILCGIFWVNEIIFKIDKSLNIKWNFLDGEFIKKNSNICYIYGNIHSILLCERLILNFLQLLSGIATITKKFVNLIKHTKIFITDTRKTIPGLRLAQKYAVNIGGGINQRLNLYDNILIKENHIKIFGNIKNILKIIKKKNINFQVEVENIKELNNALNFGAYSILLDNFTIDMIKESVYINNKKAILEVSGNIDINNIKDIAETKINKISLGTLTKDIKSIDFSLLII